MIKNPTVEPITVHTATHGLTNIAISVGTCDAKVAVKGGIMIFNGMMNGMSSDSAVSIAAIVSCLVETFFFNYNTPCRLVLSVLYTINIKNASI